MRAVSQASKSDRAVRTALAGPPHVAIRTLRRVASASPRRAALFAAMVLMSFGTVVPDLRAANDTAAPDTCEIRVLARVQNPPTEHLANALHAWHARLDNPARLQLALAAAGARLVGGIVPLHDGAALVLSVKGPRSARGGMRLTADLVAAAFHPAQFALNAVHPDGLGGLETEDLDAARAAIVATQRALSADVDTEMAASRLLLLLEGATVEHLDTCDRPASRTRSSKKTAAALLPTTEPILLRAADGALNRPPRLYGVAPLPERASEDADAMATLVAYLNHPGGSHYRALVSPNVRGIAARAAVFEESSLLVIQVDLDPRADWRDSLREATRALTVARPEPAELAGAGVLAGAAPTAAIVARQIISKALAPANTTWVFVPSSRPLDGLDAVSLDQGTRARFVAASVELTCPAPGDSRPPDVRLQEKLGIDADAWRGLARSVAVDRDALSALTREFEDRCGELGRLRKLVSLAAFATLYTEHYCHLQALKDRERAWRAQGKLMRSLGFDSALYRPILDMAAGDLRLESLMKATHESCAAVNAEERTR